MLYTIRRNFQVIDEKGERFVESCISLLSLFPLVLEHTTYVHRLRITLVTNDVQIGIPCRLAYGVDHFRQSHPHLACARWVQVGEPHHVSFRYEERMSGSHRIDV